MSPPPTVPLERALSKLGAASRTQARALIEAGRVRVDGATIHDPQRPVTPETARIDVDGRPVTQAPLRIVAFHKPRGCLTTRSDPRGRPTIYDWLPPSLDLMPVGRLDQATSGLLLLTNDTRLATWLTDPASGVERVYVATVRGLVTDDEAAALRSVEDAGERLGADAVVLKRSRRESRLRLTLTEGRNREVRRLTLTIGHEVTRLLRVSYGGLALGDLAAGAWRDVSLPETLAAFPTLPPALVRRMGARLVPPGRTG
ncbi:MAG: putative RNA pseudouridine synthase [Myxococcales bacterium]